MRVFALSDVHVDYAVNAQWIADLSLYDFTDDIIILAGDVSHKLQQVETTLAALQRRFHQVLFVPGNHDLWVGKKHPYDSIDKFQQVCALLDDMGMPIAPYHGGDLSIVPLFSWYDYSFGQPSQRLLDVWADFIACRWPNAMTAADINDYFLAMNKPHLNIRNRTVVTFSHFLPRIDVMPHYIPTQHQMLYPVLGTSKLDAHVRALNASMHVYGHSHVNRNITIEGVTYINNAFAYPNEQRIAAKRLRCIYPAESVD